MNAIRFICQIAGYSRSEPEEREPADGQFQCSEDSMAFKYFKQTKALKQKVSHDLSL
jgi:hypothetical protein